jgi:hypothetical protein
VKSPPLLTGEAVKNFQEIVKGGNLSLIVAISDPGSRIFEALLAGYQVKNPEVAPLAERKVDIRVTGELEDRFLDDPSLNPEEIFFVSDAGVMSGLNYQDLLRRYQEWLGTDEAAKELTRETSQKIAEKDSSGPLKVLIVNDADFTGGMEITARKIIPKAIAASGLTLESLQMINFFENHPVSLPGSGWIGSIQEGGVLGETFGEVLQAKQVGLSLKELWAVNSLFVAMIEQGVENENDIQALAEQIRQKGRTDNPMEILEKIIGKEGFLRFLPELYQAFEEVGRRMSGSSPIA